MARKNHAGKLDQLADSEGVDIDTLLANGTFDSVCAGICVNPDCDYTTEVEPDCSAGFCESCGTQTVASALILAGII